MHYILKVKKLHQDAIIPTRAYATDAGLDLYSVNPDFILNPGERTLVDTGISIELPKNTEGQIRPRSGLALKEGVTVLNAPGTIDEQYRNKIGVILINHGNKPVEITKGMRIAQLVIHEVVIPVIQEVENLTESERNLKGFGSSGK